MSEGKNKNFIIKEKKDLTESNFSFLINIYEKTYRSLKEKLSSNDLNIFYQKLFSCLSMCNNKGDKVSEMLHYYNLYRIYGDAFLNKNINDIHNIICSIKDNDYIDIKNADQIFDFIFKDNLDNDIKKMCKNDKEIIFSYKKIINMNFKYDEYDSTYCASKIIDRNNELISMGGNIFLYNIDELCDILNSHLFINELFLKMSENDNNLLLKNIKIYEEKINSLREKYYNLNDSMKLDFLKNSYAMVNAEDFKKVLLHDNILNYIDNLLDRIENSNNLHVL